MIKLLQQKGRRFEKIQEELGYFEDILYVFWRTFKQFGVDKQDEKKLRGKGEKCNAFSLVFDGKIIENKVLIRPYPSPVCF